MNLQDSELILNADGSIYHLNLRPENVAETIILVGDPQRVENVSKHFDTIEFKTQKREFVTHTGVLNGKRISVLSTGIGTDNIDIALNEMDALFNIDFESRSIKEKHTELNFIRLGTSGALQEEILVDSIVVSDFGLGLDNLIHSYANSFKIRELDMEEAFVKHTNWLSDKGKPYLIKGSEKLSSIFKSGKTFSGITATAPGFYAPQGRSLRLALQDETLNDKLHTFEFKNHKITNFEMETSAIYGLSKILGHNGLSLNAIIANRESKTFTKDTKKAVENLILYALDKIITL